ncbi:uncharacterized protein LOC131948921 [Physella acuta]|uniref:uncharacterized protein LOC131948921 n=1 Tax=Physella acuta TaxID=109671 RepID=UPI0027DAEE9D|nr:uncharacterized protein LOC131948921 [Physella acuta]
MECVLVIFMLMTCAQFVMTSPRGGMDYYGNSPLTAYDVSGHVDKSVTLKCHLQTGLHGRGWYVISWKRIGDHGAVISLVDLPVRDKIPEWGKDLPAQLKARMVPMITIQQSHVEFNLLITNVTCSDEGEFRCIAITPQGEVTAAAQLSIYAEPGAPEIVNKYIPDREHCSITLHCRANIGLPDKILVWYTKPPGFNYFSLLDNQRDIIKETDGCHIWGMRAVDVAITNQMFGTHFRCGYPGFIETEGMFDELVPSINDTAVGELRIISKSDAGCSEPPCEHMPCQPLIRNKEADGVTICCEPPHRARALENRTDVTQNSEPDGKSRHPSDGDKPYHDTDVRASHDDPHNSTSPISALPTFYLICYLILFISTDLL